MLSYSKAFCGPDSIAPLPAPVVADEQKAGAGRVSSGNECRLPTTPNISLCRLAGDESSGFGPGGCPFPFEFSVLVPVLVPLEPKRAGCHWCIPQKGFCHAFVRAASSWRATSPREGVSLDP